MNGTKIICDGCGMPAWLGSEETDAIESLCICESKRVTCDCCKHEFLPKDISMNNMFLALCKICHTREPYLMDNVVVARLKEKSIKASAMLCVEAIGDKLQLTMRAYHLGVSIIFPAMTKLELVSRWIQLSGWPEQIPEADFLFDAAFLRLMSDCMSKAEVSSYRKKLLQQATASLPLRASLHYVEF